METNDIALALDAIARKWDDKRAEYWENCEQFKVDADGAARSGDRSSEVRYTFNATKYEAMAGLAKEASNDAYELAARVRGLV